MAVFVISAGAVITLYACMKVSELPVRIHQKDKVKISKLAACTSQLPIYSCGVYIMSTANW